jgi:putative ABC transport system permease protein
MKMLVFDLTKLVLLAYVIVVPVTYLILRKMMQDYVHHTPISWWIFALAGGIALIIAVLTVVFHTYRLSVTNPAESLRYE